MATNTNKKVTDVYASIDWQNGDVITRQKIKNIDDAAHETTAELKAAQSRTSTGDNAPVSGSLGERLNDMIVASANSSDITDETMLWIDTDIQDYTIPTIEDLEQLQDTVNIELAGKVNVAQGSAQAGKALVVGDDGLVTTDYASIPSDIGIALLDLLNHVAYADSNGRVYYNRLYNVINKNVYPLIKAVFDPGTNIIYTDDNLNDLKQYLTVKYYETSESEGSAIGSNDYSLSGVMTEGSNVITATYNNMHAAFSVVAVNYYNQRVFTYPGNLIAENYGCGANAEKSSSREPAAFSKDTVRNRASVYAPRGDSIPTVWSDITSSATRLSGHYVIPVPNDVTNVNVSIEPSTYYVAIRKWNFNKSTSQWIYGSDTGWQQGSASTNHPASENPKFIGVNIKFGPNGTETGTIPTRVTITME